MMTSICEYRSNVGVLILSVSGLFNGLCLLNGGREGGRRNSKLVVACDL